MRDPRLHTVSHALEQLRAGNRAAYDDLFPLVYDELHRIAAGQRRRWDGCETLNTTALVNEAYLKLVDQSAPDWRGRAHFLAVAATAMRQILIDYAKRTRAAKRGGRRPHVAVEDIEAVVQGGCYGEAQSELLVALDASLRRLGRADVRQTRIVECRFFGGMTVEDTAEALGVSVATVKRGWAMAQAWLYRDLRQMTRERTP
jgi:RNA polymerase sigma factor (TIGR02999 family)